MTVPWYGEDTRCYPPDTHWILKNSVFMTSAIFFGLPASTESQWR